MVELPWEIIPRAQQPGTVYRLLKESDLARAYFDSARVILEEEVEERPEDFRIHMSLGVAYAGLSRADGAVRERKLAAEQNAAMAERTQKWQKNQSWRRCPTGT
jgi:hypothetical protein